MWNHQSALSRVRRVWHDQLHYKERALQKGKEKHRTMHHKSADSLQSPL